MFEALEDREEKDENKGKRKEAIKEDKGQEGEKDTMDNNNKNLLETRDSFKRGEDSTTSATIKKM